MTDIVLPDGTARLDRFAQLADDLAVAGGAFTDSELAELLRATAAGRIVRDAGMGYEIHVDADRMADVVTTDGVVCEAGIALPSDAVADDDVRHFIRIYFRGMRDDEF